MSRSKKILLVLLAGLVIIQFIQPARNTSKQVLPTDFENIYLLPVKVERILKNACYDCHSNNTQYPWYVNTQPVAWMMKRHIDSGKAMLNFSEFGSYSSRRQISKLKGIANQIKDDEMPLTSYKMMHPGARLTNEEKFLVINWISKITDSLSAIN